MAGNGIESAMGWVKLDSGREGYGIGMGACAGAAETLTNRRCATFFPVRSHLGHRPASGGRAR
jgi:hypothetical protein